MSMATFNLEAEVRRQYNRRVFCCIRVREAALFIGLWDFMIHTIGLCILIYLFRHDPNTTKDLMRLDWAKLNQAPLIMTPAFQANKPAENLLKNGQFISSSILLNKILEKRNITRIPAEFNTHYSDSHSDLATIKWAASLRQQDRCIIFFIILSSTILIVAHIFGILLRKPSYLIPYFLIKVFNLVVSMLSMLGFYAYMPDIKLWLLVQPNFPMKQILLDLDNQTLRLVVFSTLLLVILAKMYMAAIIWYCYGYINTLNMARAVNLHQSISTHGGYFIDQMYCPPKYEEAVRSHDDEHVNDAPPPYTPLLQNSS